MGAKSRRKGAGNENALAKLFKAWWGAGEWARTPLSGGWATAAHREAFRTCGDIITTEPGFPFCVEAKKCEGWTLDQLLHNDKPIVMQWWEQTTGETPHGMIPLLVAGRNHTPRVVIFEGAHVDTFVKRRGYKEPVALWSLYRSFVFEYSITESALVIMTLDDFFKIPPSTFGEVSRVAEPAAATEPEANGAA